MKRFVFGMALLLAGCGAASAGNYGNGPLGHVPNPACSHFDGYGRELSLDIFAGLAGYDPIQAAQLEYQTDRPGCLDSRGRPGPYKDPAYRAEKAAERAMIMAVLADQPCRMGTLPYDDLRDNHRARYARQESYHWWGKFSYRGTTYRDRTKPTPSREVVSCLDRNGRSWATFDPFTAYDRLYGLQEAMPRRVR